MAKEFRLRQLKGERCEWRRTNDEIHSSILLGPVVTCLLDTPQFQRLRELRQLGTADTVYNNCNHTRFEHSLGVAHLAKILCRRIGESQPGLRCTSKDVLCVQLAGLLHDIGHGCFSHIYEEFVKVQHPKHLEKHAELQEIYKHAPWPELPADWCHEHASLLMIDAALQHLGLEIDLHNLDAPLKQIGDGVDATTMCVFAEGGAALSEKDVLTSRDFVFVKECILGGPIPQVEEVIGPGFHGRTAVHQEWLYDIVSNRHSGLDVDKVDYYARDSRRALGDSGEIDKVIIEEAVVAWADCTDPEKCYRCQHQRRGGKHEKQHLMICYPQKIVGQAMNFFKTRYNLHDTIYKHKTTDAAALMIMDILCKADPYFLIPIAPISGSNRGSAKAEYDSLPLSRAMLHPGSYLQLIDAVIHQIAATTCPELAEARALIHRRRARDLYKYINTIKLRTQRVTDRKIWNMPESEIIQEMLSYDGKHDHEGSTISLCEDDLVVMKCKLHHGLKDMDPLTRMRFLEKSKLNKVTEANFENLPEAVVVDEEEYDSQLPRNLQECNIRLYCRDSSREKCGLASHVFDLWCQEKQGQIQVTEEAAAPRDHPAILSQENTDDEDEDDLADQLGNGNRTPPPQHLREDILLASTKITPTRRQL